MPELLATNRKLAGVEVEAPVKIRMPELISALSFALDLTGDQPMGHSVRTCVLGMRLAREIRLPLEAQGDLYYALLMKDAGCSGNSSHLFHILGGDERKAKRARKMVDWTRFNWESVEFALSHIRKGSSFPERVRALFEMAGSHKRRSHELVAIRCERGAHIARRIGLRENAATAIRSLDEHWDGKGHPEGLRGEAIPLLSRILNLAQTLDVFYRERGPSATMDVARKRSGHWFDPDLVRAARSLAAREALWTDLEDANRIVAGFEPRDESLQADEARLDDICLAFADVIDAKSPFTYRHSNGVAAAAVAMARSLGMSETGITFVRRAALLHDIGKLSVPNTILEKPGKLTSGEWDVVRLHPYYTLEILKRVPSFSRLGEIAASHHEKLDGSGYFRHYGADQLSLSARILTVADIYDALSAKRPYRDAIPPERVFQIMGKEAPHAIDSSCLEALQRAAPSEGGSMTADLARLSVQLAK